MVRSLIRSFLGLLVMLVTVAPALVGCSSGGNSDQARELKLAPVSLLPTEVQQAAPKVREAYQFAVANPEYLENFPCYCGCGAMGHMSNRDCYIRQINSDGSIVFDDHAFF